MAKEFDPESPFLTNQLVCRARKELPRRRRRGREEGPAIVGNGRFKYRVNADWAKLPDGWSFKEVGGAGPHPVDLRSLQKFDRVN